VIPFTVADPVTDRRSATGFATRIVADLRSVTIR
jgi:hypothetical protein